MIVFKPLSHIRAISFDLDETLYDNMPYIHKAQQSLNDYMHTNYPQTKSISAEQWRNIRQRVLFEQPQLKNDLGGLRKTVLTIGFMQTNMHSDKIETAVEQCFDYFYMKRSDFEVPKSVRKVLKKLASKVPLAAITNGNVDLVAIGIDTYFSCIVHASQAHPMKPNPAMFDYVSKQLDIPPKNILHVGDDLDKDVRGAIDAGYQAAWFAVNRTMDLTKEPVSMLPHIQLHELKTLKKLLK